MAFDCHERKPLSYADLFKGRTAATVPEKDNNRSGIASLCFEGSSSSSSQSWLCDSSSSGLRSPSGSEMESSESEDGDFTAELTRQMVAQCMIQDDEVEVEDDDESAAADCVSNVSEASGHAKNYHHQIRMSSPAIKDLRDGLYPNPVYETDHMPPLQVYQLSNQPPVSKQVPFSAQHKKEQHFMQYRGKGQAGSGMQAIFLRGGSGSAQGSSGTGVFLPRVAQDSVQLTKKSGCSTVLIPTRVLQTLELHFSRLSDSAAAPSLSGGSKLVSNEQRNGHIRFQNQQANHDEEMQLPQEWTY